MQDSGQHQSCNPGGNSIDCIIRTGPQQGFFSALNMQICQGRVYSCAAIHNLITPIEHDTTPKGVSVSAVNHRHTCDHSGFFFCRIAGHTQLPQQQCTTGCYIVLSVPKWKTCQRYTALLTELVKHNDESTMQASAVEYYVGQTGILLACMHPYKNAYGRKSRCYDRWRNLIQDCSHCRHIYAHWAFNCR